MKILKQEKNGNTQILEVEVEFDTFKKERELVIDNYAKEMSIPGFRKGKAPKNIIEKNLNPEAINDKAAQNMISDIYPALIKEHNIDPVDYPKVDIIKLEENEPFLFKIEVDVYPEINLGEYKGIKINKKSTEVTEEEVTYAIGNIQDRISKFVDVKTESATTQKGNNLTLEIGAQVEGIDVKSWPRQVENFPLGKNLINEEFDANIEGLKAGEEKSFKIKFNETYHIKEVALKEVDFNVKVKKIQHKELIPIDDEFAKKVSEFGTLAELKKELRINMEQEKKDQAEADLKNQIIDGVSKNAEVLLPSSLINIEIDIMLDELKASLSRSNLTLENYLKSIRKTEEELRNELKMPATSRAKGKVVLKKIAQVENLEVTPYDFDTEIALMAQGNDIPAEEYKKSLGEGTIRYVNDYILRRKALDFLISNANIS